MTFWGKRYGGIEGTAVWCWRAVGFGFLGVSACLAIGVAPAVAGSFDTVEIAAPVEALTFARVGGGVLLVKEYRDGIVKGVNLTCALGWPVADPIAVFLQEGYRRLRNLAATPPPDCLLASRVGDLRMPVDLAGHHIAAGTNFPEHAGESQVEGGPFLFAKIVEPSAFDASVPAGEGLLDYEAELGWVALEAVRAGDAPQSMGLILCNDYTDRETLLRKVDVSNVESGVGFTTGKSFPGYLPVGNLFVIPANYREFSEALRLRLYVNGAMRQDSMVAEAIWDIDELLAQTWKGQDRRWDHRGAEVSLLLEPDVIAARTLLLGGTPSGTAFQGISLRTQLAGVASWVFGGWGKSIVDNVIDEYAERAREEKRFLQAGDEVVIHVDRLGVIDNQIEASMQ